MTTLSNIAMPTGSIVAFAGSVIPAEYLLCNGQTASRVAEARLFAVIGTMYGEGDGVNTFNVPDLVGYFIKGGTPDGAKNADTTKPNGLTVGSDNANHGHSGSSGNQSATHTHTVTATSGNQSANHNHTVTATSGNQSANHSHTVTATSGGRSASHTHSIASSGAHNHSGYYVAGVAVTGGGTYSLFCANNTGATFQLNTTTGDHTHSTGNDSADHSHTITPSCGGVSANHNHTITPSCGNVSADHNHAITPSCGNASADHNHAITVSAGNAAHAHALTGDAETAPKNVKMNYLIKT